MECTYNIDEELDFCDFDENQLSQVANNIVINAQQAMPSGGKMSIHAKNILLKDNEISTLKEGNFVKISGSSPKFVG